MSVIQPSVNVGPIFPCQGKVRAVLMPLWCQEAGAIRELTPMQSDP